MRCSLRWTYCCAAIRLWLHKTIDLTWAENASLVRHSLFAMCTCQQVKNPEKTALKHLTLIGAEHSLAAYRYNLDDDTDSE